MLWALADLNLLDRPLALDDALLRGVRHLRERGANAGTLRMSCASSQRGSGGAPGSAPAAAAASAAPPPAPRPTGHVAPK